MKLKFSGKLVFRIAVVLVIAAITTTVAVAWDEEPPTNITPTSPKPGWNGTNWQLTASAGTDPEEAVCVEFALDSDGGCDTLTNYTRVEGTYGNPLDGAKHAWQFSYTPATIFKNVTAPAVVCYQFYVDDDSDNCEPPGGGYPGSYTGFNWSFSTGPNALTLRSIEASPAATAWPAALGLGAVLLAGGAVAWRRRK